MTYIKKCKRCRYAPKAKIYIDMSKAFQKLYFNLVSTCVKCGYENFKKSKFISCDFNDPIIKKYNIAVVNISKIKHKHINKFDKCILVNNTNCTHCYLNYCSICGASMNNKLEKFNIFNRCEHVNNKLKILCNNCGIQYLDLIKYIDEYLINIKTKFALNYLEKITENHKTLRCPKTGKYLI